MSDVIRLNRFRKKKSAAEAEKRAAVNRAKFGRTKAEKAKDRDAEKERARLLDAHKIDES